MNPGGVILVVGGIAMVLIGVRGSQSSVFAAITGKAGAKSTTASVTDFSPAAGVGASVAAPAPTAPTQTAPQTWLA